MILAPRSTYNLKSFGEICKLHGNYELGTAEFVYEARRQGIVLWCRVVDNTARIREMKTLSTQGTTSDQSEYFIIVKPTITWTFRGGEDTILASGSGGSFAD